MRSGSTGSAPRRLFEELLSSTIDPRLPAIGFLADDGTLRDLTRGRLAAEAEQLGLRIRQQLPGRDRGQLVAILTGDPYAQVLHFLAALAAGLVPAILTPPTSKQDPDWYRAGLTGVLAAMTPDLLITDLTGVLPDAGDAVPSTRPAIGDLWGAGTPRQAAGSAVRKTPPALPPDTAFVQFSSGTTGVKKGVVVTTTAALAQLRTYAAALDVQPFAAGNGERPAAGDCVVSWLPLYHDMGLVTALLLPLATGMRCVLQHPLEWVARPASYLQAVSRFGATRGWHPNFAYAFLAARPRERDLAGVDLASLNFLANCGEPVTATAQRNFADRFGAYGLRADVFAGCWAMAETTFAVTSGFDSQHHDLDPTGPAGVPSRGSGPRLPAVSVGRPLDGVRIEVRDAAGAIVPAGQLGELWVSAPFLAAGYYGTATGPSPFRDGWYGTGDLGYQRDGAYYVTGRAKDVIIVAGVNVFPDDVEAIVAAQSGVRAGRVVAVGDFDERKQTERVLVLAEPVESQPVESQSVDVVAVLRELSGALHLTDVRVRLVPHGWLVKSSSGKISRAGSAAKWRRERAASPAPAVPAQPVPPPLVPVQPVPLQRSASDGAETVGESEVPSC